MKVDITIDMDAKCRRCGHLGACNNGYCLKCNTKRLEEGAFDGILRKAREKEEP